MEKVTELNVISFGFLKRIRLLYVPNTEMFQCRFMKVEPNCIRRREEMRTVSTR